MRGNSRALAKALPLAVAVLLIAPAAFAQEGDDMTFEPDEIDTEEAEPPPDNKPPTKTLQRATKLYDEGKYYPASIEFQKVLGGNTQDSEANVHRAEFFLGKTLYQLGFYAASLSYFDRIVQKGHGHKYFGATLKWLAALSRVLPETSGILDKIGRYDPADLEDPIMDEVRDELYFLLGRHYYRDGDFVAAVDMFQRVGRASPFFIKAKFFEAVTYVRQYKGAPAVDAFKEILVIGEERPADYEPEQIRKFTELARLQLARVFYSTQQYNTAIKYYEKIPQASPDWLDSLCEASWAYFMKTNNSKALGNIHTLNAPYFEDQFFPESVILKSVIYYKYCLYERALESVAEYNQTFRPLREELKNVLGKYEDNAEFYNYVLKIVEGEAGLPDETERLVVSALTDRTVEKTFNWVDELDKELKMLDEAEKSWSTTAVATRVLEDLTLQKDLAQADAGQLARERVERLEDELQEFSRDALKIRIEVLNAKAGQISAESRGEQISGGHKPEPIVVDDEHFMWKFNGEYWKDELGFYRFKIASKCPAKGAPQ